MHSEALFNEEDLEQQNGDEMQVDGTKNQETKDNELAQAKDTTTNHETTREASHKHASLVGPSKEPSYEELKKQLEQSQQSLVAIQEQYEVYREKSQQELEASREECTRLLDQLTTQKTELQIQTKKYTDLKEKFYKWYHYFLKVWAEKFRKNETEEPPPGIPNMSPRDSEKDRQPVVTPSPWANRTESTSTSMEPKRLSASLRDSKETTGTVTKSIDSSARVHKVDSPMEAEESYDAGSETQLGGPLPEMRSSSPASSSMEPKRLSASLCDVESKETMSRGTSNGGVGAGDKKVSRLDSPLEAEELHDAGSERRLNGPSRESLPANKSIEPERLSASLRETDSKKTMSRGTLKEINDNWEKTSPVQADELNDAGSETQLSGPSPEKHTTSPPNKTIEPKRLSGTETMTRGTSNGGVGAGDKKRSRVGPPIEDDESNDVGSETQLNGPSHKKRSCSPANKSIEPKRLSTSLRESDSNETMTRGRSKKTVDSGDKKTSRVNSPIKADELNDASSETELNDPSPVKRSKSPASTTVEPKWLTASMRERSHKETITRGTLKKNVDSRDKKRPRVNSSPITFDDSDDAGSETQLNGPEKRSSALAKKSIAHKQLSASSHETDRKETVTRETLKKRSDSGDKQTSRVDSAVQPDEMDDETQLNGPSPEKQSRLEKMGAESTSIGIRQTLEKGEETGIDPSPVLEGSETQLGYDPTAYHEKKGTEGKELVFLKTSPSSPTEESSARRPDKVSPSTSTKPMSPATDISIRPVKLDVDYEHEDPSQALFSQLSEAPILRQPLGRAKPTPGTLKDRTNVKPACVRKAVPGWTSNVVARNFVQSVSTRSVGKKPPAKEERKPASILSASTPSVGKKPAVKEERKPAFVPSVVTVPETETKNRNTGTMQPPRNPFAAQRPFVAKASVSSLSTSRASRTLYEDSEDSYRYQEVVRCKHDRQNLPGHECPQCSDFVDAICHGEGGEVFNRKELMDCSRHRAAHSPENTPKWFWELSFQDEIEKRKRLAENEHPTEDSDSDERLAENEHPTEDSDSDERLAENEHSTEDSDSDEI
jgi:hypothetical protein